MQNQISLLEQLCNNNELKNNQGYANTFIEEVKLFKISSNEEMMPLLYNKGFSFIGQGKKVGYISDKRFEHGCNDFLIITSPQPIDCQTFIYEQNCMMGIYINLNMVRLHKIIDKMNQFSNINECKKEIPFSVISNKRTNIIDEIYTRILETLLNPLDSLMLSEHLLDELYFRILQSENGYILRQLCQEDHSFAKISSAVEYIHKNLKEKIHLEDVAKIANMSVNNFHRIFKEALNDTPIQYIKKIRLNKARHLILYNKLKAIDAAYSVGYDSPTQFSREFKRYFGVSPSKIGTLGYKNF